MLPLNSAIQSAAFCTLRAPVFDLFVHVARRRVPKQLGGDAHALAHGGEQSMAASGCRRSKMIEIASVDSQRFHRPGDNDRSRPRSVVEERELTEEIALAGDLEDDALPGVVLEEDLGLSGANHDTANLPGLRS